MTHRRFPQLLLNTTRRAHVPDPSTRNTIIGVPAAEFNTTRPRGARSKRTGSALGGDTACYSQAVNVGDQ